MGIELHLISTGRQSRQEFVALASELHRYVHAIHIREKDKTAKWMLDTVLVLIDHGVPPSKIIINDRVDVALATHVKGVQLAYHSIPPILVKKEFPSLQVGCSVHSVDEVKIAQEQGVDYMIFGHIFPTNSKQGLEPRGIEQLNQIVELSNIPIIAIGGIKPNHVPQILKAGAKGIAIMSGILEAEDPLEAVKAYTDKLELV
ncbi:thiazole tautomerase TenI [Aquibacillus koreensis]|uniref:Thiazole tautomerase TenI n=1 Tax=Aquibacillus koreensis TaxID=279446 RepID=A0A9X4AIF3_9BACI|nr:thiazole tautomerase TenI [Aquibacillus koreensis]MCT2534271.1 thiazole tautomerase TenI [Aquibacillus koreensis]MDC3420684.1 thiazole tautomerase TenI [Aquibacillus koreensis]